jgi:hypothetical protein
LRDKRKPDASRRGYGLATPSTSIAGGGDEGEVAPVAKGPPSSLLCLAKRRTRTSRAWGAGPRADSRGHPAAACRQQAKNRPDSRSPHPSERCGVEALVRLDEERRDEGTLRLLRPRARDEDPDRGDHDAEAHRRKR